MPLYDFKDTETGEIITKLMSISSREEFLESNPNMVGVITTAPSLVSGVGLKDKTDSGWKDNLSRIAEAHPNSALADKVGGRSTKQVKVNDAAKKRGLRKSGQYKMDEL